MARLRPYTETAALRNVDGSPLARLIARYESMPRTLPRDTGKREALRSVGERETRLGPSR